MCAFYSALRVRPFDPDPERTEEEVAAVRLGCTLDELKPGASRVSYVGEELTEQGKSVLVDRQPCPRPLLRT